MNTPSSDMVLGAGLTWLAGSVVFFLWRGIGPALTMTTEAWAAWVQAVGSVGAILVAIGLSRHDRAEKRRLARDLNFIVLLRCIEGAGNICRCTNDKKWGDLSRHVTHLDETLRLGRSIDLSALETLHARALLNLLSFLAEYRGWAASPEARADDARSRSVRYYAGFCTLINGVPRALRGNAGLAEYTAVRGEYADVTQFGMPAGAAPAQQHVPTSAGTQAMDPKCPIDVELRVNNLVGELTILRFLAQSMLSTNPSWPDVLTTTLRYSQAHLDGKRSLPAMEAMFAGAHRAMDNLRSIGTQLASRDGVNWHPPS